MFVTCFSATWFARELRSARRTAVAVGLPHYAALVSARGMVSTGTGWGFGLTPVYRNRRFVGTAPLPYPLVTR